MYYLSR
jgi:hypothetical protein